VAEAVSDWRVDHLNPVVQLIASELVTNAVEHAGTDVDLHVTRLRNGICIAVHDDDPHPPVLTRRAAERGGPLRPRGRGLRIVARSADHWGVLTGTGDKVVWAELRDTAAAPIAGRHRRAA
jgi:anti-sigma regulatory factor (Ser/Thr protein kinase)